MPATSKLLVTLKCFITNDVGEIIAPWWMVLIVSDAVTGTTTCPFDSRSPTQGGVPDIIPDVAEVLYGVGRR